MTATEKLLKFVRAVKAARDLRRIPEHERGRHWPEEMRAANRVVDELLDAHLGDQEQPEVPAPPSAENRDLPPLEPDMPALPPLPSAEQPTGPPKAKRRGGQQND